MEYWVKIKLQQDETKFKKKMKLKNKYIIKKLFKNYDKHTVMSNVWVYRMNVANYKYFDNYVTGEGSDVPHTIRM